MAGDIYHWNIGGIKCKRSTNYNDKINQLSSILEKASSTLILNIQETHISNEAELPKILETYSHIYNFIKAFSNINDSFSGIIIGIRKTEDIVATEILEPGRLLYIKSQNQSNKELTNIFSIYCNPSNSGKQKQLIQMIQEKITLNHLNSESCIVLGDFNFVTSILDRNSQTMNRTDIETSKLWDPFEENLALQDSFRINNPSRRLYTLTSKSNKKFMSRIDRVYITANLSGKIVSSTFIYTKLSDHKIVKVKLASDMEKGAGLWVFNNSLLKDNIYITDTTTIIRDCMNQRGDFDNDKDFWDFLKQNIISFSKTYSREKARLSNLTFQSQKNELFKLESIRSSNLTSANTERIELLKTQIDNFQKTKIQGTLLRSKIPNFEENDPQISFLSSLEKRKGEDNTIYNLLDTDTNCIASTTKEIKNIVYKFYKKLYTKEEEDTDLQTTFLEKLDTNVEDRDREISDRILTETNLHDALKNMNSDRSPGPDGLSKEWYECFWTNIKTPYINAVRAIEGSKELTEMQKRGAIKISHKKGERNLINNYRPITLLNVDLKIVTKALADRMKLILPKIINQNQTCVPGRHIENSIHTIQGLIDHANEKCKNLAMIFIDQEKAFDRISHAFIFKTLEKFGFGQYFIDWVKTICTNTKSFVKVNGFETFEFTTERGVRQGCPLSPLLYVLTAEVLSNYIRKNKKIKGYRYKMRNLSPLEHKLTQYADDTTAALTDNASIHELFDTLSKYEKATNAKVNTDKTEALWVGNWKNRQDQPLNLKWTNKNVKVLGIYVGNKVGANGTKLLSELNFADQLEKIKNKMIFWRNSSTLVTKVKVLNVFILSRLWYRTNVCDITQNHLDALNRLIRNFIWGARRGGRVRQGVLQMSLEQGGLQLVDISCKIKAQRTKRIMYLFTLDNDNIERFLADELIGTSKGQEGLSFGLLNNSTRIRSIENVFYKNALEVVKSLHLELTPASYSTIRDEPLFYNNLFLNPNTNNVFILNRYKNLMPKTVKDLQHHNRSNIVEVNDVVQSLRVCLNNLTFSNEEENKFSTQIDNNLVDIRNLFFRDIYKKFSNDKLEIKEWEVRWRRYLPEYEIPWRSVWQNLHTKNYNPYIKTTLWEMYHLNFWSNYRANSRCKLCFESEEDITHIVNSCKVLTSLIRYFNIQNKFGNKPEITFGSNKEITSNYVLFHIKTVTFRSRFRDFNNIQECTTILANKCKSNIKYDLKSKLHIAKQTNKLDDFINTFVNPREPHIATPFQICNLNTENELIFLL